MNTEAKECILVVEDDATTADIIEAFLVHAGYRVELASDGQQCLELLDQETFDGVLLDIMLPGMDGISICKHIRSISAVPIVMLTARTDTHDIVKGLEAGADDYVKKPFNGVELVARVKSALRRNGVFNDSGSRRLSSGAFHLDLDTKTLEYMDMNIALTPAEFGILKVFCSFPGRVFSREQLIQAAFDHQYEGFDRNIDVHISNLRKKLGESSRHQKHLLTEFGIGYRFKPEIPVYEKNP